MSVKSPTVEGFDRDRWSESVATVSHTRSKIISGSVIMLVGSSVVSLVNFGYNIAVARLLGPASFSHAAAAVTLLMLVSAITLAFQLVCAKFIARNETAAGRAGVYQGLRRKAWIVGLALGCSLVVLSEPIQSYLRLPSPSLVIMLAAGIAFYIPLGVTRGALQGTCEFGKLSVNFALEAIVKFVAAVVLISVGMGVNGAVIAIAFSVIVAYFLPPVPAELRITPGRTTPASFGEGMQAIIFFVGQVLINNIDILMVKHFFPPAEAGVYAAIALVGRVLYFASWSIVSAMFPISAGAKQEDKAKSVIIIPLLAVAAISGGFILVLRMFPQSILQALFGSGFEGADVRPLLSLYAAATGAYALSVVLMAYEISRKIANTAWLQLIFSALVMLGISVFHDSLRDVVMVQQVLMVLLLAAVSVPFVFDRIRRVRGAA
jgi:O-antigen/teichoic acid export membrane protein